MLNLHEMVKGNGPIYVKNTTSRLQSGQGQGMKLMIGFKDPHGRTSTVKIPNMKYPVDIAAMVAPRERLTESTDFMRLLQIGALELVATEKAQQVLSKPGAQAAIAREYGKGKDDMLKLPSAKKKFKLRVKGEGLHDPSLAETEGVDYEERMDMEFPEEFLDPNAPNIEADYEHVQEDLDVSESLNPRVLKLMATLQADPNSKSEVLADLDAIDEDSYTDEDLGYILDKARSQPIVTTWARKLMASRQPAAPRKKRNKKHRR